MFATLCHRQIPCTTASSKREDARQKAEDSAEPFAGTIGEAEKNRIGWLVVSTHYKRSNQNQSLEVIKIITVDHHLQIWSNKNMSGTGMLPHKGRILRQFKRGIALYFETPPQNSDPISIIGCTLW
jgi:hypothetical protein